MRNILLTLKYDGTNYHGWQIQPNAITVQQVLQQAVKLIVKDTDNIIGCSRTDSGVHANMYCCNFKTESEIETEKLKDALNANIPDDIAVVSAVEVADDFHSRYDCKEKEYIYRIWNSAVINPFEYKYTLQYKYPLDEKLLDKASKAFLGEHDFKGFCSVGSTVESTVRTVFDSQVTRQGDMVTFKVSANGFLYNMVRIMAGTLLYVAQGKIKAEDLPDIIKSGERERAGITAAPQGLFLNKVVYQDGRVKDGR
ncbi:MAG: tRNA pseudouridine(38-40) synthase TruA [Clostridiales bacterium]|nr:tRNA pseudouridine(38-40) synthase TruA [Clostridiales bacterium]